MNLSGRRLRWAQRAIAIRDRELPYRHVSSQAPLIEAVATSVIPPVVIQSWQDNRVGRTHLLQIEEFRQRNPDIRFELFTNADQADFMSSNFHGERILRVFEASRNGVMRADIFRYCVLYLRGGVYLDFSKYLTTPIRTFLDVQSPFVLSHERNLLPSDLAVQTDERDPNHQQLFVQWCLMSTAGHRFLARMIENIERHAHRVSGVPVQDVKGELLRLTSSHMWTKSVWESLNQEWGSDFVLWGVDYGEERFPLIVGSYSRYLFRRHYSHSRDQVILDSLD